MRLDPEDHKAIAVHLLEQIFTVVYLVLLVGSAIWFALKYGPELIFLLIALALDPPQWVWSVVILGVFLICSAIWKKMDVFHDRKPPPLPQEDQGCRRDARRY
jgi:uncharacterized membrane protein YqjE